MQSKGNDSLRKRQRRFLSLTGFTCTVILLQGLFSLNGCVTMDYIPTQRPRPSHSQIQGLAGMYHRVERGQTLWWISRMYGVDLEEIVSINNITDAAQVNVGQYLFIPRRSKAVTAHSSPGANVQDFVWPGKGKVIAGFGNKSGNAINKGVNIRLNAKSDIVASSFGTVVFTHEKLKGYGKTIIIAHDGGLMTVYSLLSHILVRPGECITQGTVIARCENGIMHFEIRKGYIPQNPNYYLPALRTIAQSKK